VALDYFDIDIRVDSTTGSSQCERVDSNAPIPMLYVQAALDLEVVSLLVEGGWINAEIRDTDGTFVDLAAMLRVPIHDRIHLFAGYRYIGLDGNGQIDDQNLAADLTINGWMAGLGVSF
jgi:hypothetical protein